MTTSKPPRDLGPATKGLAPPAPPGPPAGFAHLGLDAMLLLSDEAKAVVIGPQVDIVGKAQAAGESAHTVMRMRGMLRRLIRSMYEYELRRNDASRPVDLDPTTW